MTRARRPTGPIVAVIVVLLCVFLGQFAGLAVFEPLIGPSPERLLFGPLGLPEQLTLTLGFAPVLVLLAAWIRWKERRPVGGVGFLPASRVGLNLGRGAVVAIVLLGIPVLANFVTGEFVLAPGPVVRTAQLGGVVVALLGFLVQGTTEEVLTRGYLMQAFYRRWGVSAAVIGQGVVFMALHGLNSGISLVALVNLVLIAVLLAFWALAEGGLWGVCAFHGVWNWAQGNVYGVQVSGLDVRTALFDLDPVAGGADAVTGGAFGVEGSVLTTAVLAVGVVLSVLLYRRSRQIGA